MTDITSVPQYIQITDKLTGYGYNLEANGNKVVLFFGGSNYIAYNSVGKYADKSSYPFLAVDYYGTQDSKGKMNLQTMKKSATELYDWAQKQYPQAEIIIMGHSYGVSVAASLQEKLSDCFENSELKIFDDITHENYLISEEVVKYINSVIVQI